MFYKGNIDISGYFEITLDNQWPVHQLVLLLYLRYYQGLQHDQCELLEMNLM